MRKANSSFKGSGSSKTQVEKFAAFADTGGLRDNLTRKSVRGVLFMVGGGGIDFVLRLASIFVLARLLSPNDFGLVAMVVSVTAIAEQFAELGLSTATIQCRELTHQQVTNLFWINAATGCLFCLAICGTSPWIAGFYENPDLVPMIVAIATTFIWGGLTVQHQALLSRQMKQAHMAAVRLSASFLSLALAVLLAVNHFGVWALAWREISRAFFVAAGMWIFCPWIPGLPRRKADIRGLLRYGSHLTLSQFAIACVSQLDRLLVGRFFGATPLGLYRQAQQLILAPIEQLRSPVYSVAAPSLSMLQPDADRYRRYYQRIVLVIGLLTMPLGLFITIYAVEITHVVLGSKWIDATVFLRIFGLVAFLKPCLDTPTVVMITYGLSKRLLTISIAFNALFAAAMFAGTRWGAQGVALSNVVIYVLLMFPLLHFSLLRTPVSIKAFLAAISTPAIASATMAAVLLAMYHFVSQYGMLVSLSCGVCVAGLVYALVVFLLPRGRRELRVLITAVLDAFRRQRSPVVVFDESEKLAVS